MGCDSKQDSTSSWYFSVDLTIAVSEHCSHAIQSQRFNSPLVFEKLREIMKNEFGKLLLIAKGSGKNSLQYVTERLVVKA